MLWPQCGQGVFRDARVLLQIELLRRGYGDQNRASAQIPGKYRCQLLFCDYPENRNPSVPFSDFLEDIADGKLLTMGTLGTKSNGEGKYS